MTIVIFVMAVWFLTGLYVTSFYNSWVKEIPYRKLRIFVRALLTLFGVLVPVTHVVFALIFLAISGVVICVEKFLE